jgi:hypothetical protein
MVAIAMAKDERQAVYRIWKLFGLKPSIASGLGA